MEDTVLFLEARLESRQTGFVSLVPLSGKVPYRTPVRQQPRAVRRFQTYGMPPILHGATQIVLCGIVRVRLGPLDVANCTAEPSLAERQDGQVDRNDSKMVLRAAVSRLRVRFRGRKRSDLQSRVQVCRRMTDHRAELQKRRSLRACLLSPHSQPRYVLSVLCKLYRLTVACWITAARSDYRHARHSRRERGFCQMTDITTVGLRCPREGTRAGSLSYRRRRSLRIFATVVIVYRESRNLQREWPRGWIYQVPSFPSVSIYTGGLTVLEIFGFVKKKKTQLDKLSSARIR